MVCTDTDDAEPVFTFVGTTRGQGIIRIVVVLVVVAKFPIFWKIFKVNKALLSLVMSVLEP